MFLDSVNVFPLSHDIFQGHSDLSANLSILLIFWVQIRSWPIVIVPLDVLTQLRDLSGCQTDWPGY